MDKVIISLTTYPARINYISRVLDSIVSQTYAPDKIVLYLSETQFFGKKIPIDLSQYFKQGLEIHWCQGDMKSHKKYLYAFREYPDDYIITIDDDFYYEKHMIEELVQDIHNFPQCILARRVHLITAERNGSIAQYTDWWGQCTRYIEEPRMDLFAVGCGGILYPPYILNTEVFHIDNIKKYCMYADDIWLKIMELINEIPVVQVSTRYLDICAEEFVANGLYQQYNGYGGNDRQLQQLMKVYDNFNGLKETLTEKIFSDGIIYKDEVSDKERRNNLKMVETWLDTICKDKDIVIYGAGIVAKRVYGLLKMHHKEQRVRKFAVEMLDKNEANIDNIEVVQYKDVDYTNVICVIALSDLKEQQQVCKQLLTYGIDECQICFLNKKLQHALRIAKEECKFKYEI